MRGVLLDPTTGRPEGDQRYRHLPLSVRRHLAHAGLLRFLGLPQPEMLDPHANFSYSTVATAPSPATSGTSLTVQSGDGAGFPATPFNATVWPAGSQPTRANAEIVRVTAGPPGGDTFTITRTQEGTSARSIGAGDQIAAVMSAKLLTDIETTLGVGVYGDGSDGTVTFDGTTTVLGLAPAASVYTLTRDIFLANGTINSGVVITTNGFRIFCSGVLTNNGTIRWNGGNSNLNGAGAAANNTASTINPNTGGSGPGTPGVAGGSGVGTNGTAASTVISMGGQGGSGGASTNAGGSGGALNTPPLLVPLRFMPYPILGFGMKQSGTTPIMQVCGGGTAGGAGGGNGTNISAGSGGGGGIVIVVARLIQGTGAIQARGGNGGTPSTAGGGGGGGGGGWVSIVSQSVIAGAVAGQTIDANGGTGGNGAGGGAAGSNGNSGTVTLIPH